MRKIFTIVLSLLLFPLQALPQFVLCGRADVGPALYRIQVLEEEEVVQQLDMYGLRADGTFLFIKDSGFAVKPTISAARGDGDFLSYGAGIGYYIPFCGDHCYLVPVIGLNWTDLTTILDELDIEFPIVTTLRDVGEEFLSNSRYVGFELMCQVCESFWTTFIYQYAWANSKTFLTDPFFPEGKSVIDGATQGSNFALAFDYYFKDNWSVNLAVGFNSSLDEGRSGIRGYGAKLSIGYSFK
ncbi:MAG: hypothetical protein K940chlam3_00370 [Chlamydiae bacterium]|nr:hypothetical protein [Chlamydiota bacterium]